MFVSILTVTTRRLKFEIPIKGKYTIIRGHSGTGKSTLIRTLMQKNSKVEFLMPVVALPNDSSTLYLEDETRPQTLFYGDEDLEYLRTMEFQQAMAKSKHCFLLVTRNKLASLAYAASDVLQIQMQGKVHRGVMIYTLPTDLAGMVNVCTEDSKSGYYLIKSIVPEVMTANGKDKVTQKMEKLTHTLFIADGLGFGHCIDDAMSALELPNGNKLYLFQSFEELVLHSKFCGQTQTPAWDCPNKEQTYTGMLTALFRANDIQYNKSGAIGCLQQDCCYKGTKCGLFKRGCKPELILGTELYEQLCIIGKTGNTTCFDESGTNVKVTQKDT